MSSNDNILTNLILGTQNEFEWDLFFKFLNRIKIKNVLMFISFLNFTLYTCINCLTCSGFMSAFKCKRFYLQDESFIIS